MALAQNTPIVHELGDYNELPVAASTNIYEGAMVGMNSSGYCRGLVAGDLFCGHASAQADNSAVATNGAKRVKTLKGRYALQVTLASVAVTDVGKVVYASDDGTLSLSAGKTAVGRVLRYVTTNTCVVEFVAFNPGQPIVREFDCQTGEDSAAKVLLPAWANPGGLLVRSVYARVTEVFGGATEDQGVVTVRDTAGTPNTITTITVADAGGDAAGDVRLGYDVSRATAGDAAKTVAAGLAIEGIVSTATSGSGAAGKVKVYLDVVPLD